MTAKTPTFLTYDEAVAAAKAEPNVDFIGIGFEAPYRHLAAYSVSTDDEDPGYLNVSYSGGDLFSSCGEEDFYSEDDVPAEAKMLFYARDSELGDGKPGIFGMTGAYVLYAVLPGLKTTDAYETDAEFADLAVQIFKRFWRHA
jgi:hypothetical protein